MFGNVVAFVVVWECPITSERLAQDGIEWFLHASVKRVRTDFGWLFV